MLAVECYCYEGAAAEDVEYIGGESASANVDALDLELQKMDYVSCIGKFGKVALVHSSLRTNSSPGTLC